MRESGRKSEAGLQAVKVNEREGESQQSLPHALDGAKSESESRPSTSRFILVLESVSKGVAHQKDGTNACSPGKQRLAKKEAGVSGVQKSELRLSLMITFTAPHFRPPLLVVSLSVSLFCVSRICWLIISTANPPHPLLLHAICISIS